MRNITKQTTGLRIKAIEEKIGYLSTMREQVNGGLKVLQDALPEAREEAYPADKSETTQEAKDNFKEFLDGIKDMKQANRDIDSQEDKFNREISAFNYINYNIEEATKYKTGGLKVLVIDLDSDMKGAVPIAMLTSDVSEGINLGASPLEDLQTNIDIADKVVTFAREDAIERLKELGITVTKEDRKFTSIHHLMRGYTDFQREGLATYAEVLDYTRVDEDVFSNVYNLMRVYMGIVDIETVETRVEQSDESVEGMLAQLKEVQPMLVELETLVYTMESPSMTQSELMDELNSLVKSEEV